MNCLLYLSRESSYSLPYFKLTCKPRKNVSGQKLIWEKVPDFRPGRGERGGGEGVGGTAIYGLYRYVPLYGFQAVYSRIGYIN